MPLLDTENGVPLSHPEWGMPVYECKSGLSDSRRFVSSGDLEKSCVDFVKKQGGELFFRQKNWRKALREFTAHFQSGQKSNGEFESREAHRIRIKNEVDLSKKKLEEKLEKNEVSAFACPRHAMGQVFLRQIDESSYHFLFGGLLSPEQEEIKNLNVQFINRVDEDFLFRLPGTGRHSFLKIILGKAKSRNH